MSSFFDFLNAINDTKKDLIKEDPHTEKDYVPFMVNRGLSYFGDTVMYANEMNMHTSIPKKWQFEFYLTGVKKKKRFSKWAKKESTSDDLKLIMQEYNYSSKRAQEALDMLTNEQLKSIRESYKTGGK
jgi:NACalpha-BTF3-like transcription factor